MSKDYIPPETEVLTQEPEKVVEPTLPDLQEAPGLKPPVIKEPSMTPEPDVIAIAKLVNGEKTAVTDVMTARIDRHFKYLSGAVGFADAQARHEEQVTFIETIGNTLQADFPVYALVTDHLLTKIRENYKLFSSGEAFRFIQGLDPKFPVDIIRQYKLYIELLTKIAGHWKQRYRLKKLVDPAAVMPDMNQKARTNLSQYFNKLSSV